MPALAIVGPGRFGWALFDVVSEIDSSWTVTEPVGRGFSLSANPINDADLVMLAVPDSAIAPVAHAVPLGPVLAHGAGALTLNVLSPHVLVASAHPLITIPDRLTGSKRLRAACPFAVEGHPLIAELVEALGGRAFTIPAADRALYHAAAVVASNHVVTVLAQAERLFDKLGLPAELFGPLMAAAVEDVGRVGARAGLTGPAVRADFATIADHLRALPVNERALYRAIAQAAVQLGENDWPQELDADPLPSNP